MLEITQLQSILHCNLEHDYSIFSHQFVGHPHLGEKFSKVEDESHSYFKELEDHIIATIPQKDFKIGNTEYKVHTRVLWIAFHFKWNIVGQALVNYQTNGYSWNEMAEVHIDKVEGLREQLEQLHNSAHKEHGLEMRW